LDVLTGILVFFAVGALMGGFLIEVATGRLSLAIFLPPTLLGLSLPIWWTVQDSTDWQRWLGLLINVFLLSFLLTLPLSAAAAGIGFWLRRIRRR